MSIELHPRTTGRRFDREVRGRHELVVEVRSGGGGRGRRSRPRVARAVVEVDVLDINDNAPAFVNRPYHAVMSKEAERDSTVIKVNNNQLYRRVCRLSSESSS